MPASHSRVVWMEPLERIPYRDVDGPDHPKMKLLYLNPSGQMGGAENVLLALIAGLRRSQPSWNVSLLLGEDGPVRTCAEKLGVAVSVLPFPRTLSRVGDAGLASGHFARIRRISSLLAAIPAGLFYAWKLAAKLRELDPDIVHTNGIKMHVLGAWLAPSRARVVFHIHDYLSARPLARRIVRATKRRCDVFVANSKSVAEDIAIVCGTDTRIVTIYNGVDMDRFHPSGIQSNLDLKSGAAVAAQETLRVGLVATFARWKGHFIFLRALSLLPNGLNVRGYIVGGALYQTDQSQCTLRELECEVERLGIRDRVVFTGFIDDPAAAMRALDVVVHASTESEPFGMVVLEAMACGRAVIASSAGGAVEIFEDGVTALGHPMGDAEALRNQIVRLASDRLLRARLGRGARAAVINRFDAGRMAQEFQSLYLQTVCSSMPRRKSTSETTDGGALRGASAE